MLDTMSRYIQGLSSFRDTFTLQRLLTPLFDRYSSQTITSAGLVINAGGAAFPKIGAADYYAVVGGALVKIVAGTALPALTGINAPAGGFNVACYFVDNGGVVTVAGGTPSATLGGVIFPQFPLKKALVGYMIITNAGAFTGGTTALDGGTTIYVSPIGGGAFDPTALV